MGNDIGDFFYPDNPHRRDRASQLHKDCENIISSYNSDKNTLDATEPAIRQKMMDFLKQHGYDTLDDLDKHVKEIADGETLANWVQLKTEIGGRSLFDDIILVMCGLSVTIAGIGLGVAVMAGAMTGAAAWSGLGEVAGIAALVTGIVILVDGIAAGADERSDLRKAIHDMGVQRVKLKQELMKLEVMRSWSVTFDNYFSDDLLNQYPEYFAVKYAESLDKDFWRTSVSDAIMALNTLDQSRDSWTNEDYDTYDLGALAEGNGRSVFQGEYADKMEIESYLNPTVDSQHWESAINAAQAKASYFENKVAYGNPTEAVAARKNLAILRTSPLFKYNTLQKYTDRFNPTNSIISTLNPKIKVWTIDDFPKQGNFKLENPKESLPEYRTFKYDSKFDDLVGKVQDVKTGMKWFIIATIPIHPADTLKLPLSDIIFQIRPEGEDARFTEGIKISVDGRSAAQIASQSAAYGHWMDSLYRPTSRL